MSFRVHQPPDPEPARPSRWTLAGRDFLVYAWSAADFAALPPADRGIVRGARARRQDDGSWHLLIAA